MDKNGLDTKKRQSTQLKGGELGLDGKILEPKAASAGCVAALKTKPTLELNIVS